MAWRTTQEKVREVVGSDESISMSPFIDFATELVDYVVTQDSSSILTTGMKERIETYLAAHFYAIRDLQYHDKKTADASAKFQGVTDMGFDATLWGQQAKRGDLTGTLARLDKEPRAKATMDWLGLPPSEQTAYVDRD